MKRLAGTAASILLAACGAAAPTPERAGASTLQGELDEIAARIDGRVAIAVVSLDVGSTLERGGEWAVNGDTPMPQQSTFKAWLAVAAADAVERGEASWEDEVRIERAHLLFPYQPIAEEVGPEGSAFTLAHLVEQVLLVSDNPSADAILRHLGGTEAVQAALERRGVEGVRITTNEEGLHALADRLRAEVAELPEEDARAHLLAALAADPNAATALGAARSLARLARGELLSEASTRRILSLMEASETGQARLRAGLAPGWTLAHKTGSGFEVAGVSLGANDIGVLTAPDGRRYAVAVFVAGTTADAATRDAVIADAARAVTRSEASR